MKCIPRGLRWSAGRAITGFFFLSFFLPAVFFYWVLTAADGSLLGREREKKKQLYEEAISARPVETIAPCLFRSLFAFGFLRPLFVLSIHPIPPSSTHSSTARRKALLTCKEAKKKSEINRLRTADIDNAIHHYSVLMQWFFFPNKILSPSGDEQVSIQFFFLRNLFSLSPSCNRPQSDKHSNR